ncbi:MAG: hypothetical protein KatS3mg032_0361 [Cyclobacteriaceae bacterium]|nr:MAG: hypothetical protein KatS3mg032_0361 [Cyclobacteriaceae bacterium]
MAFKQIFHLSRLPREVRKQVIGHYVNKILGKPGSTLQKTSKNILKLAGGLPEFEIEEFSEQHVVIKLLTKQPVHIHARPYPSSDLFTLKEVWANHEYEPAVQLLCRQNTTDPLIVDAGSNAGYSALYFATYVPNARIICIEPDAENFNILKTNLSANHIMPAKLIQGALYPRSSRLEIKSDYRGGTHASYYVAEQPEGSIQGYTFQDIVKEFANPVDLLKVDIEGAESLLFEDPAIAFPILERLQAIAIEIHDEKANRTRILENLKKSGFLVFTRGETTFGHRR